MSDGTKIEWTDATWNPITGCSVVSAGCKHCYAMKLAGTRLQHHPSRAGLTVDTNNGPVWTGDVRFNKQWLDQPIRWSKQRLVFPCAHSDLFHPNVPDEWIDTIMGVMWACLYGRNEQDGHIFQVLTKRAQRMRDYFKTDRREAWARAAVNHGGGTDPDGIWDQVMDFNGPHPRIWLGVSVEDQAAADERIPLLLDTPAAVRWISAEPLLGPVDLTSVPAINPNAHVTVDCLNGQWSDGAECNRIDWVVVGGESGTGARPMHPDWARSLRDQCAVAGVPFLFKQWGEWAPGENCGGPMIQTQQTADYFAGKWSFGSMTPRQSEECHIDDEPMLYRCGKKAAGRPLDGVQHDGYPE